MTTKSLVQDLAPGPDLRLEVLDLPHADAIFRLVDADRARLGAWFAWVEGTRRPEDTRAFIRSAIAGRDGPEGAGGGCEWAMRWNGPAGETLVGVVGIHDVHRADRRASIGYWIAGPYEGRGLVTRAAAALVDHAFGAGFHRIEIRADVDNRRSRAIPERLAFTLEGVLRDVVWVGGRPRDHAVYARLATDAGAAPG